MKREELCQNIDDIYYEETEEFDANDVDDDLYDAPSDIFCCEAKDVTCEPDTNNIFLLHNNLHEKRYKKILKHTIYGFKEVSLSFSLHNINRILSVTGNAFKDVSSVIAKYGKEKPNITDEEVERIVGIYVKCLQYSGDVSDVVTCFIDMWGEGTVNDVITYYFTKANSRNKRNTSTVSVENIICSFNADSLRELYFEVTPTDKQFDPLDNRELFMVEDNARIFWNLYMLLVFYDVCGITPANECSFFEHFHNVINLAMISGMRMFVQHRLPCSYGELYQELQGVKTINGKYLAVEDISAHQQIYFKVCNSDFLTEAYKNDYSGAVYIPSHVKDVKNDKHTDIQLWVKKGATNNSVLLDVIFSGQNPIGRIYDCETDPETVINFLNIFNYCPDSLKPVMYLFKQMLNYSKDNGITSYYTEIQKYLKQFKGRKTRNLVPKLLNIILEILHSRPSEAELEATLSKYYKETDSKQKCEFRKIYNELKVLLKPKKVRILDKLRVELESYVW